MTPKGTCRRLCSQPCFAVDGVCPCASNSRPGRFWHDPASTGLAFRSCVVSLKVRLWLSGKRHVDVRPTQEHGQDCRLKRSILEIKCCTFSSSANHVALHRSRRTVFSQCLMPAGPDEIPLSQQRYSCPQGQMPHKGRWIHLQSVGFSNVADRTIGRFPPTPPARILCQRQRGGPAWPHSGHKGRLPCVPVLENVVLDSCRSALRSRLPLLLALQKMHALLGSGLGPFGCPKPFAHVERAEQRLSSCGK